MSLIEYYLPKADIKMHPLLKRCYMRDPYRDLEKS